MAVALATLASCGGANSVDVPAPKPDDVAVVRSAVVAGGAFTTFDQTIQGCLDSPNGVNCNNYDSKGSVYASGGPTAAGVSDGTYYFAVLTPGAQNGGFVEGAAGNLSDATGGGDDISNRTFTVTNHAITSYGGTHAVGTSPNGKYIIGLAPFDDTDNAGGVYILAVCTAGATSPSQCKFDAFRIKSGDVVPPLFPVISGAKYYDANANGVRDPGEVGIAGWPIAFTDGIADTVVTDAAGAFSLTLIADQYTFAERLAASPWKQTGNLTDQTASSGGATAVLNANKTYTVTVVDNSAVSGLLFGNLCVGKGGGLTLGFWSNKNGQALFGADDLALMVTLHLRNANGTDFDPAGYNAFRTWLLAATATNMANMLSAQLAAMELNVLNGMVNTGALIYAPGTVSANANGFATVSAVMVEADSSLAANGNTTAAGPLRTSQEALKNALDAANNNLNFVQAGPASCPAPVFP
ncbi:MAG TPA: hypothetical protein VNO55_07810 [Polyangia bacterium]|nr:hypothetical protein [Polyangia bacterium]